MAKRRGITAPLLLAILIAGVVAASFWFGFVPQRLSPFPPISLGVKGQWFVDARLATLRRDPELCGSVLKEPHVAATPVEDRPIRDGCGWTNSMQMTSAGGASLPARPLTCEMAAAISLWMSNEVQPLAEELFGQRVTSMRNMGTYDCRNIVGNPMWRNVRSQHATANAQDIGGFSLADGTQIGVLQHWNDTGARGRFLREIHRKSCRYFRVSLGPNFNPAHRDHFHFDRGPLWTCK